MWRIGGELNGRGATLPVSHTAFFSAVSSALVSVSALAMTGTTLIWQREDVRWEVRNEARRLTLVCSALSACTSSGLSLGGRGLGHCELWPLTTHPREVGLMK